MAPETLTLIRDALALDPDQRAVVANALLQSLHPSSESDDIGEPWLTEAARRLDTARDGSSGTIDADAHYARLRASLAE